jgi:rod shape-determining protein MreB
VSRPYDVAIDAGTGFFRMFGVARGLFAEIPAVAADPSAPAARPLHGGVVVEPELASRLIGDLLRRVRASAHPAVLASVPSDATEIEKERLREALVRAGAGRVTLVLEPLAGAIGAGLDLGSPFSRMIVDVGEGVTDVAVLREGEVELTTAARIGVAALRAVSPEAVEGALANPRAPAREELRRAIQPVLDCIVAPIREAWSRLSEQASCEVIEDGICLAGGGAELACVRERIQTVTRLDVRVAERPRHAVIRGNSLMAVEAYGPGR